MFAAFVFIQTFMLVPYRNFYSLSLAGVIGFRLNTNLILRFAIQLKSNKTFLRQSHYFRSSCPEVLYKKGVLKNFPKFTGKHLCRSLFFNKVAGLWWLLLLLLSSVSNLKIRLVLTLKQVTLAKLKTIKFPIRHLTLFVNV